MVSAADAPHSSPERSYGDLTRLNTERLILDAVGVPALENIASDFIELTGNSCAVYEINGDYALGIFTSGWCQLMDEASFRLCRTSDLRAALDSGHWLCHESCWSDASRSCIDQGAPVDIACHGGLRLYAVPIEADGHVIGSINFGYGAPPDDPAELERLAQRYHIPAETLAAAAKDHPRFSDTHLEQARRRLSNAARLIGLMVERHIAQESARQADERYRLLFETIDQGVTFFDAEGRVMAANRAACRILGRTEAELFAETGDQAAELIDEQGQVIPFEQLPAVRAIREVRRVGGELIGYPNPVDGQIHWIRGDAVPLLAPGESRPRELYSVFSDVTEQKAAQDALRASEERLRLSMQAANQGLYDLDLTTGAATVSPEYATMLGYDPAQFVETNARWLERMHPDDRPSVEEAFRAYVAGETSEYSVEFRQRTRDGGWKWTWSLGKIVERNADGTPSRMMGTHTDIDDRKRLEQEKRRSEAQMRHVQKLESLGVLAGGIAHDFNNLLMAVLGNAELINDAIGPAHPANEYVGEITTSAKRAAELCRQMLAYSGKGRFILEELDLSRIVEGMGHILQVSVSKKAALRYDLDPNLPAIEADPAQVRQIIMNLITNASEALGDTPGVVSVKSGQMHCDRSYLKTLLLGDELSEGCYVYIEVGDTGVGMDEATQAQIFDPFFTTKFMGRGLGLAAAQGIVRGHQGAIKLYSEPGRGTTFKVLFPALDAKPSFSAATTQAKEVWRGSGLILVADDEPHVLKVASRMLQHLGFGVVEAADGRQALDRFQKNPDGFAGVLLDLTMPRMNGEETFRELRRIQSDVRVILSSGYSEREIAHRFAGKGQAGFIQKPYTLDGLRKTLQAVFDP